MTIGLFSTVKVKFSPGSSVAAARRPPIAIGGRLAAATELPGENFTFTVLNSPIVNAMALPGGYVYVTRGLLALAQNEAEAAGVIGHEIGHVIARHTAARISRG